MVLTSIFNAVYNDIVAVLTAIGHRGRHHMPPIVGNGGNGNGAADFSQSSNSNLIVILLADF